jgi:NAD-dependent SIR2 family protein deacetylase
LAKENGARLVLVNREATPLDAAADLILRGDIGDLLDPLGRHSGSRPQASEKTPL